MNALTMHTHSWVRECSPVMMFGGLLFALPAVIVVYLAVVKPVMLAFDARDWLRTEATLVSAQLKSTHTENGPSHQVMASYWYRVNDRKFHSTRVSLHDGNDNIGSYHERMAASLRRSLNNGTAVAVYVDPLDPTRAVLDRSLRPELLAFVLAISSVFLAIGLGLMIWGYRGRAVNRSSEVLRKPWLAHPDWQGGAIRDTRTPSMVVTLGSAILWNLIVWPLTYHVFANRPELPMWASLLLGSMALVGLPMLWRSVRLYRNGRIRGRAFVTLHPFPGQIGGVVAGHLDLPDLQHPVAEIKHTLQVECHQWVRSGKRRRKRTEVLWQDEMPHEEVLSATGKRTHFAIRIPQDLPASDIDSAEQWYQWRVIVECTLKTGRVLQSRFVIPVYAVDAAVAPIEPSALITRRQARLLEREPKSDWQGTPFRTSHACVRQLDYPLGHDPTMPLGALLLGTLFTGAGVFLANAGAGGSEIQWGPLLMSVPFLLVGLSATIWSVVELLSSRTVQIDGVHITTIRRVFGIVMRQRKAALSAVTGFAMKKAGSSTTGDKTRQYFTIGAELCNGEFLSVAWRIEGRPKARSVTAWLYASCNLPQPVVAAMDSDLAQQADSDDDTRFAA